MKPLISLQYDEAHQQLRSTTAVVSVFDKVRVHISVDQSSPHKPKLQLLCLDPAIHEPPTQPLLAVPVGLQPRSTAAVLEGHQCECAVSDDTLAQSNISERKRQKMDNNEDAEVSPQPAKRRKAI